MATDDRVWRFRVDRAGNVMVPFSFRDLGKGASFPVEVEVVRKSRAEAAEQRVVELDKRLRRMRARAHEAEAKLATAVEALRAVDTTRNSRILCVHHGGEMGADEPDTCNCGIAIDADKKMREIAHQALSKIEGGEQK